MNNSAIVFLVNDEARAVRATYEDGHSPDLFKTMDPTIAVDDLVVVETTTRHGMTVVKITEVDVDVDFDSNATIKWVVQKVDHGLHDKLVEQEKEAIATVHAAERDRKKKELRASLFAHHEDKLAALQIAHSADDEAIDED